MNTLKYVPLKNIVGNTQATQTTVSLFNSCLKQHNDSKGKYLIVAVKAHLFGVLTEKQYL